MTPALLGTSSSGRPQRPDKHRKMSNNRPMNTQRKFFAALLAAAAILWLVPRAAAATDAGACYAVSDPDRRAYCLAKAHKDPGRCYSIKDQALRAECLAETR